MSHPSIHPLVSLVNPLQGTDSHYGFSKGNTLPIVAMPFGMNHWSPQTAVGRWFFHPGDRKLLGIRCTHQPSPWMADYGAITLLPQSGPLRTSPERRSTAYRPDLSVFLPHYFQTELIQTGTTLEFSPTERAGIFRFVFPAGAPARIVVDPADGESAFHVLEDGHTVVGFTRGNSGGAPDGFALYFVGHVDRPITGVTRFVGHEMLEDDKERPGERVGVAIELGVADAEPVLLRVATSFISIAQARQNLAQEIGDRSFEEIVQQGESVWAANLSCIEVDPEADLNARRTFYSCLYRTQLFPRIWHEVDAEGHLRHYSPYDGQIHDGVLYTDNGFWDTFRTEYPLLALLSPARLAEILQGWVHAYQEGGWFPQWATPGYRACMVGTHIDAVMADAVARGIRNFDIETAFQGLLKHAYEVGDPAGAYGRIGIEDYLRLGYVGAEHHESVARSLDYAYDDFCIAQVGEAIGRTDDAAPLLARAANYRHLYDPEVGFMRGKHADGTWLTPWDEFQWGSPYVEGGPWQASWAVPHDPAGLMALMGGEEAFVAKLDRMLTTPPRFSVGDYGFEIHEMTEMACADFGQYAHSNQPVHHVLYLYNAAGRPWRTQETVRRVMDRLYTPDDLPGDEDNGEMCAWYVLSALGIFPHCPGHPSWTFGSPMFKWARLHFEDGAMLTVEAPDNSASHVFVRERTWNGEVDGSLTIDHRTLVQGGRLGFAMSETPNEAVSPVAARPFSMTPYPSE